MTGKTLSLLAAATLTIAAHASAAVSYAGGTYSQDFNGLPSTGSKTNVGRGPLDLNDRIVWDNTAGATGTSGWTGSNFGGSSVDTELRAQDGSLSGSAGRGIISYGTTGSGERALGFLATSNQISRYGVELTNTSSDTYISANLSFTGEQWRAGDAGVSNSLSFAYSLSAANINDDPAFTALPSFNFSSPNSAGPQGALNGNLPANQQLFAGAITGLNWTPGSTLTLRWTTNEVSGADTGLAIDDLSLTGVVPEPASAAILVLGSMLLLRRRV